MAKLKTKTNQPVVDSEGLLDHLAQDGNTTQVGGDLEVDGTIKGNKGFGHKDRVVTYEDEDGNMILEISNLLNMDVNLIVLERENDGRQYIYCPICTLNELYDVDTSTKAPALGTVYINYSGEGFKLVFDSDVLQTYDGEGWFVYYNTVAVAEGYMMEL